MNVLYLTNIPSPYRVDFFNELGKLCKLTVLYERRAASDRDNKWKSNKSENFTSIYLNGKNIKSDSAICLDVIKWIKKDKFDAIIVGGYSTPTGMLAIQLLKMKNIPFILNTDGGFIKKDNRIMYFIKKYFISKASWWLSTGEMTTKYLEHYGAKKEKIFVYPFTSMQEHEILHEILTTEEKSIIRKEIGLPQKKIALYVGQFIHRKGYDILINAWNNVRNEYELLLIGSGEEEEELKKLIDINNLSNIKIIEFKPKEELIKYYLASDLFILPTREDIWGLVVNEAMACGLPIITTNRCIAGNELVVDDVNGYNINLYNEDNKLSENINLILDDDEKRKIMSENSLKIIREYTLKNMAKRHMEIINMAEE